MSEPKTKPQSFAVQVHTVPNPAHADWLERTEQLLATFEKTLPDQTGEPMALGFVLLAADYLWDHQGEQADFLRLDVRDLFARCEPLLNEAGVAQGFADALARFYTFLAATPGIESDAAIAIGAEFRALVHQFEPCS